MGWLPEFPRAQTTWPARSCVGTPTLLNFHFLLTTKCLFPLIPPAPLAFEVRTYFFWLLSLLMAFHRTTDYPRQTLPDHHKPQPPTGSIQGQDHRPKGAHQGRSILSYLLMDSLAVILRTSEFWKGGTRRERRCVG